MDHRGADLGADRVHALVVLDPQLLVPGVVVRGRDQLDRQPGLLEGGGDHVVAEPGLLVVDQPAHGVVERAQHLGAVLLLGGDAHPYAGPAVDHALAVLLRDLAALVEHGQAHDVEPGLHRPDLLDLQHPAGGDPGPGAAGVDPDVGGDRLGTGRRGAHDGRSSFRSDGRHGRARARLGGVRPGAGERGEVDGGTASGQDGRTRSGARPAEPLRGGSDRVRSPSVSGRAHR